MWKPLKEVGLIDLLTTTKGLTYVIRVLSCERWSMLYHTIVLLLIFTDGLVLNYRLVGDFLSLARFQWGSLLENLV